jgi:hypothetical protein
VVNSTILGGFADLSAKVRKIIDILGKLRVKYILSVAVVLIFVQFVFGLPAAPVFTNVHAKLEQQDTLKRDSIRRTREMREVADSLLSAADISQDSLAALGDTIVNRR